LIFARARFFSKRKRKFFVLDFFGEKRRKAEIRLSLFIFLAVLDPNPPIRGRQQGTPVLVVFLADYGRL